MLVNESQGIVYGLTLAMLSEEGRCKHTGHKMSCGLVSSAYVFALTLVGLYLLVNEQTSTTGNALELHSFRH